MTAVSCNTAFFLSNHASFDNEILWAKIAADIDPESLRLALQVLTDRHPNLRTSFSFELNATIGSSGHGGSLSGMINATDNFNGSSNAINVGPENDKKFSSVDSAHRSSVAESAHVFENQNVASHGKWVAHVSAPGEPGAIARLEVKNYDNENIELGKSIAAAIKLKQFSSDHHLLKAAYVEFDVTNGPLMKVWLHLNVGCSGDNFLVVAVDQSIWDKWSFTNFIDELKVLYQSTAANLTFSLPPLSIDPAAFSHWQIDIMFGEEGDRLWSFWHEILQLPLPILALPIDKPRPALQTFQASSVSFRLPAELTSSLRMLAEKQGATMYALMLAAFQTFLFRYTGQDDICIGGICSARSLDPALAELIGHFENLVVYRSTKAHGNPIFLDLLQDVRQQVVTVRAHSELPFPLVMERLLADEKQQGSCSLADESRAPIFQVMFDYQYSESGRSSSMPLSTMFGLALGESASGSTFGGLGLEPLEYFASQSKYDLGIQLAIIDEELTARWTFNTDIFVAATIERMAHHFFTLLSSIFSNPEQKLSDLAIIDSLERERLLVEWNNTSAPFPHEKLLHQLVEKTAEETPNSLALVCEGTKITYGQLNSRANQLAHYLRFSGVQPEDPVPIFLERSPLFIISLVAVLKAGGVCMPLDPAYPSHRLEYMFQQSEAKVMITVSSMLSRLPSSTKFVCASSFSESDKTSSEAQLRIVALDLESELILEGSIVNPLPQTFPTSLAYILYTSGSTGQPKGVCLSHISLVSYTSWHINYYEMTVADRHAHYSSLAFDASMAETWPTLAIGASLWLVCDQETRLNPQKLLLWFAENAITMSFLTTQLCENVLSATPYPPDLSLRILYTGGDKLHRGPPIGAPFKLINIYGPTENTINSTMCVVPAGQLTPPPIGKAVPNTQIYILDLQMQPVPIGVYGELYLGGIQLAKGYFKRSDLTSEKFIPNPFSDDKSTRLYRTGDLVRYLSDGTVEFLGRRDTQVKIRGFRIELDEVESALLELDGLSQVCVMAREDRPGDKKLVAYVVLSSSLTALEMRNALKEKLPSYMVPSAIIILPFLPLTPNGKLARNELPAPQLEDFAVSKFVAPVTTTQKIVAESVAAILQLPQVGMDDHFFDLGGHSLSATQLLSRLKSRFNIDMPLSRLLGHTSTIGQLAGYIDTLIHANFQAQDVLQHGLLAPVDLNRVPTSKPGENKFGESASVHRFLDIPSPTNKRELSVHGSNFDFAEVPENSLLALSFNQNSLYFLSQLDPTGYASMAYNIPFAAKFFNKVDPDLLHRSLRELQCRHSVLRTLYAQVKMPGSDVNQFFQVVKSQKESEELLEWQDINVNVLTNKKGTEEESIRNYMLKETYKPIDLERGPTLKARIITASNGDQYFLLLVHHIAVDLWSMVVLLKELQSIYSVLYRQGSVVRDMLPVKMQYFHSVAEQARIIASEELWSYWQQVLAEPLPVLQLPLDLPRPPYQNYLGAALNISVPRSVLKQLRAFAKADNSTLYTVLLAAYYTLLQRYSQQDDLIIGTPMACRTSLAREECAGYFVNPVALRCNAGGNPSFRSFMQRVRNIVLSALSHQELPFSLLVEKLKVQRDPSRSPIFQTLFVLQKPHIYGDEGLAMFFVNENGYRINLKNMHGTPLDPSGNAIPAPDASKDALEVESFAIGHQHAQFDLTLMCAESATSLVCSFHYSTGLFNANTISRMAEHYLTLLKSIVANPDASLSALSIMSPQERNLVVCSMNNTARDFPKEKCVHELVEAQVLRTPNALAVCSPILSQFSNPENDPASSLTYVQLNVKANQLAHYLRFLGCTKETLVPILLHRSPLFIISLLAILKAGGVCVPVDPSYPKQRLLYMLEQSEATLVITESNLLDNLPAESLTSNVRIIVVDKTRQSRLIGLGNTNNPINIVKPSNLAYILYTSGSTGKPKGVMLPHISLVNYISWHIPFYEMTAKDRHAHFSSMSFDASMAETWPTLSLGASLWQVVGDDIRLRPDKLMNWMTTYKITMAFLTTQLCESLLATPYPENFTMRILYTGGDKLHRGATAGANFRLVNIYGPTECTINILLCTVPTGSMVPPPIGKVVANTNIYILDEQMEPVPLGVYGELYIGGIQLSRGYFRRPDLTKEKFVPNPFSSDPTSRLYRTGDLVRYLPDGTVEFLGRKDGQVKIRGFRIELGEIEAAIIESNEIAECTVICREDRPGEKKLVGYIVLKKDHSLKIGDLKQRLRLKLPEFMIPSAIVFLDALLLTPNGKIDRNALPAPTIDDVSSDRDFVAPKTPLESVLVEICCQVLGLARVGMNDNFFDLGGHSLAAAQLLARIREKTLVDLPLGRLFETPTLSALADSIQSMRIAPTSSQSIKANTLNPVASNMYASVAATPISRGSRGASPITLPATALSGVVQDFSSLLLPPTGVKSLFASGSETPRTALSDSSQRTTTLSVKRMVNTLTLEQRQNSVANYQRVARVDMKREALQVPGTVDIAKKSKALQLLRSNPPQIFGPKATTNVEASSISKDAVPLSRTYSSSPRFATFPISPSASQQPSSFKEEKVKAVEDDLFKLENQCKHPMTYQQSSLWFMSKLDPAAVTYTVYFVAKIISPVDDNVLFHALRLLMQRHPSLRTTFMEDGGASLQYVHPMSFSSVFSEQEGCHVPGKYPSNFKHPAFQDAMNVDLKVVDARKFSSSELEAALHVETHTPFDLVRGPVFRARFFRQNSNEEVQCPVAGEKDAALKPNVHTATDDYLQQTSKKSGENEKKSRDNFVSNFEAAAATKNANERKNNNTMKAAGVLHLMAHHIAIDGWSLDLLVQDFGLLYDYCLKTKAAWSPCDQALLSGNWTNEDPKYWDTVALDSILEPSGSTPAQYAYYQRRILNSSEGEKMLSFWQRTLAAPLPILNLITDKPRPPVATYKGRTLSFDLPVKLCEGIRRLAKQEKSTVYMVLLSSYLLLLQKYTHQDDILVGTPMACRSQMHLERTVGNLVNPAVLRADLSGNPTFSQLLSRVKQLIIAVFSHQDYPFTLLVKKLFNYRDPSRSPFFQVFFSLNQKFMKSSSSSFVDGESSGFMALSEALSHIEPLRFPQEVSPFDMTLVMTETDTSMSASFQYNVDLFNESTIQRISIHFQNLLFNITADARAILSDISCLNEKEWRLVTSDWNQTKVEVKGRCVHRLFEIQVAVAPSAIALSDGMLHLSYHELNKRANQLSHYLRDFLNVKPGNIVAVCLKRGYQLILAHLAIMKSGAAYLPIDPAYPSDRVEYMLEDSGAKLVLYESSVSLQVSKVTLLQIDTMWSVIKCYPSYNPRSSAHVSGTDLVYIVYTSGSTGKPKGVAIMHEPLVSMSQWHAREYKHTFSDRSSQMIAPAFDPVALELWPYLTIGASVHVISDANRSVPANLIRWLCAARVTSVLFATPVAETVIHEKWPSHHCVKFITAGGDKLHRGPRYPQTFRFDNHYGPSEGTIIATCSTLKTEYDSNNECIAVAPPIGKPVSNTFCYVLDSYLQPVPIGVTGELFIGGSCLARCYWNRPELTKERFIRSPFSADPTERIYKTGDLVRFLPDGNLEFMGRVDLQVKIRGFRVELGEIESALASHISIRECCVDVREPKAGNKQLVGYIVWYKDHASNIDKIKAFLKESLPEFMVPSGFVILEHLPLTANGKVDRKKLPEPDWQAGSGQEFVAPENITQITVAGIWSNVLGVEKVGLYDSFFDLGGHSLTAALLLSKIRDEFGGLEIPISKLFEESTVFKLSAFIDSLKNGLMNLASSASGIVAMDYSEEAIKVWQSSSLQELLQSQLQKDHKLLDSTRLFKLSQLNSPSKSIFLTGASGYLGAFLLAKLLTGFPGVDIHCLVRAKNSEQGLSRVLENLKAYDLLREDVAHSQNRIIPVCGDLSKPLFGLNFDCFDLLAMKLSGSNNGVIYHCGALVNSVLPYSQLKAPNVLGTIEVLRLSIQAGVIPIHHVSTLSVFPDGDYAQAVTEISTLGSASHLKEGYAISKCVADQVLIYAFQHHNLPITIYRPGRITGDSSKGITSVEDVMCRMTKGCLQLGYAPELDWLLDMTPVDFVSNAIVALSKHQTFSPCIGGSQLCPTYHLCNNSPIHWSNFVKWINKYGYTLALVAYQEWREKLITVCRAAEKSGIVGNALQPVLSIFGNSSEAMGTTKTMPKFDASFSFSKLAKYSISCPLIDENLLSLYFQFYISSGFLAPPDKDVEQFCFDEETKTNL